MLQVARAFEAELALRQGRFAAASRWAEKYQAKTYQLNYRFYIPQVTLIRILLAQGTMNSLQQAADLLDKLYDFFESIHNNCFRIDALALQALLHVARGEESAALEKFSQALSLAEPGGFIRLFVDLGPQIADLQKQLIRQNIAVDYARQILAAFSEDEHGLSADSSHPGSPSPHPLQIPPSLQGVSHTGRRSHR